MLKKYFCLFGLICLSTCSKQDDGVPPDNDVCETTSTLIDNVMPILLTSCAIPTCHLPDGQSPDLTKKSNVISHSALIGAKVENRTMPPARANIQLSNEEIEQIMCWVKQGALDN